MSCATYAQPFVAAFALMGCNDPKSATDGTGGSTTYGTGGSTTTGVEAGCERREAGDTSLPGFAWSVGCESPVSHPGLAPLDDNGLALVLPAHEDEGRIDLGGDVFTLQGIGSVVVARLDANGHHLWSQLLRTHQVQEYARVRALPADSMVLGVAADGPLAVGGSTIEMEPSRTSTAIVALDQDGALRWSRVASATTAGGSVLPRRVESSTDGSIAVELLAYDPFWIGAEGPFGPDAKDGVVAVFEADGALRRAGAPGRLYDLQGDGSLLLDYFANSGLRRTDAEWETVWFQAFVGMPVGDTVAHFTPAGEVVVAGSFGYSLDVGGDELTNHGFLADLGNSAVFVARYGADGAHRWSQSRLDQRAVIGLGVDESEVMTLVMLGPTYQIRIERISETGASLAVFDPPAPVPAATAILPGGAVVFAGSTNSAHDFGGGLMPLQADVQVWLAKYAP